METIPVSVSAWCRCLIVFVLLMSGMVESAMSQGEAPQEQDQPGMPFNWPTKTMGGRQFWTDVVHISGWRIQRHAVTGHHRLIDRENVRQGWGTLPQCQTRLSKILDQGAVPPNSEKVVIVLHGLMRSSNSMEPISRYIRENSDYQTINMEYASSRSDVASHARDLAFLIDHLGKDVKEISFVAHSMGNIVVRHYLKDLNGSGTQADPRFHRMVMMGPPNQGSQMARFLKNNLLFKSLAGVPGIELGEQWEDLAPRLATPHFEFGIISGAQTESQKFNNFILNGPDDFTVSLKETRLVGARDWLVRPLLHTTMMKNEIALESTVRFLKSGYFLSAAEANPILPSSPETER